MDDPVKKCRLTPISHVPAAPTQNATLAWDGENRLITTTVAGTETTAQYDALSRRIAQTTGATREVTLYDGWNCIAEYEGAANTLHATNLWGTDLSGSPQGAGGVGGLLAVQKHTGLAIGINYPLYDGNGNITEYLDAAGAVVARYKYDPFGRIYASSGTRKDAFPYRFSTKRLDAATGLYYYGYRYYDPITGRWLSRDPVEEDGGGNLYGYLSNSAIDNVDLLGLVSAELTYYYGRAKIYQQIFYKLVVTPLWKDDYQIKVSLSQETTVNTEGKSVFKKGLQKSATVDGENVTLTLDKAIWKKNGATLKDLDDTESDGAYPYCVQCQRWDGWVTPPNTVGNNLAFMGSIPGLSKIGKGIIWGAQQVAPKPGQVYFSVIICGDGKRAIAVAGIPQAGSAGTAGSPITVYGAWIHSNPGGATDVLNERGGEPKYEKYE